MADGPEFTGNLNLSKDRLISKVDKTTSPPRSIPRTGGGGAITAPNNGWLLNSFNFDLPAKTWSLPVPPAEPEPEYYYWKWNETDTSQFTLADGDAGLTMGKFQGTPGGGVMPCLVMSGTKVNSYGVWTINDLPALPRRYYIYALFWVGRDAAAGAGPAVIPMYLNSNFWISYVQGLNAVSNVINSVKNENGTRYLHSSSFQCPSFNNSGSRVGITVLHSNNDLNSAPGVKLVGSAPFQGNSVATTLGDLMWGSGSNALNGTWDLASMSATGKVAIGFNPLSSSNANLTGANQFQLAKLIIFKHPMDWENT